jgi:hypothetical protein
MPHQKPAGMNPFNTLSTSVTLVVLVGICATGEAQTTLILTPSQDAPIGYHDNFNSANTNYNSAIHCSPVSQPGSQGGVNKSRGLMKFDLSSIPSDATVLGAFLTLSASGPTDGSGAVTSIGSIGQNSSKVLRITSTWNDATVTWNTQPTTTTLNAVPLPQSTYSMQNYLNINVTALVQNMVADPANSFGFMLKLDNETPTRGLCFFGGLAPEPDKVPTLVVVYGDCNHVNIGEIDGGSGHLTISPSIISPGATIQLDMGQPVTGRTELVLMNALGQTVYTRPADRWPMSLSTPALARGTYTWKVQDATGSALGIARMMVQ